jgi:23S rRNA pseudouridine2605 synthase
VLAAAGVASRRAAEELIAAGRVRVDGDVVRVQGRRVDPKTARIEVDGDRIDVDPEHEYWIVNKPAGMVTTANDPEGRRTVAELVRGKRRLYPVGRLDADTTGLVIMTNHGEMAHRLMHPRFEVARVYVAEVKGAPDRRALDRLLEGIELDDGLARAKRVRAVGRARERGQIEIVMAEGRNREVRRMFDAIGFPVLQLVRVAFGPVRLGDLGSGHTRRLTPPEVGKLLSAVGM